ncbi:hypothetical protein [Arthrobacter gyeryongensis]|uniref:hypothetical protein n=1 Tax=Arthrobacter gyeryongensis TaxID=1650592 RepID=UPI0031EDD3B9
MGDLGCCLRCKSGASCCFCCGRCGCCCRGLADSEGTYNETSVEADVFINGDRVLTDNVELFDGLVSGGTNTYVVHVKRDFDVKVRDVRSQIINSAQIIENDLRVGSLAKLKAHHARLVNWGRTTISEADFLKLFDQPRVYVLAYGSKVKVSESTLTNFGSSVARMEVVSLNNQFRQLGSAESMAKLRVAWIKIDEGQGADGQSK